MPVKTFKKDPAAKKDYTIDWAQKGYLAAAETIVTSSWSVPSGLTNVTESNTTKRATVWLSGGTHGQDYDVVNHIVTSAGREEDGHLTIEVRDGCLEGV